MFEGRIKWAAYQAVSLALPSAVRLWGPALVPRRPSSGASIVVATLVQAPSTKAPERLQADTPTSLLWAVTAPTSGSRVGVRIGGVVLGVDVPVSGTAEDTRDALLDEFAREGGTLLSRLLPGVTAVAVGTDSIRLTTTVLGRLCEPSTFGPGAALTVEASTPCEVRTGRASGTLEFEAFAAGPGIAASAMLSELELALAGYDVEATGALSGVTLGRNAIGDIVPLDSLAGPTWESRATMRVAVSLRLYRAVAVDYIETADFDGLRITDATGTQVGIDQFEVTPP